MLNQESRRAAGRREEMQQLEEKKVMEEGLYMESEIKREQEAAVSPGAAPAARSNKLVRCVQKKVQWGMTWGLTGLPNGKGPGRHLPAVHDGHVAVLQASS
jgi:hypothetical protein